MLKEDILKAYNFRHACKVFDTTKTISNEDFNTILECAILSPTSFGMQGVKLYVITDKTKKEKLKPFCWNQNQIDSCSHLVVFTTKTEDLKPDSKWVKQRFDDRGLSDEMREAYLKRYRDFHQDKDIYEWGAKQTYITMANMLSVASMLDIDSCPIEGFEKDKVESVLGIDITKEEVSVIASFGYRLNPQSKRYRLDLKEMVEFL